MGTVNFRKNDTYRNMYDGFLQIRGHVNAVDNLPVSGVTKGDIYTVGDSKLLYIYNEGWSPMGGSDGGAPTHMVVHGTMTVPESGNPMMFAPDDGQPTFSEAVEAFKSGIPVTLVSYVEENATVSANVISHAILASDSLAVLIAMSEGLIIWGNVESTDPDPDPDPGPQPKQ